MHIDDLTSNEAVAAEIGRRIQSARISYPLTQAQLAERSGVSQRTVANLERGSDVTMGSLVSILRALGLLSRMDMLVPDEEVRPAELLAGTPRRQRVRTSSKTTPSRSWKWGDEQ